MSTPKPESPPPTRWARRMSAAVRVFTAAPKPELWTELSSSSVSVPMSEAGTRMTRRAPSVTVAGARPARRPSLAATRPVSGHRTTAKSPATSTGATTGRTSQPNSARMARVSQLAAPWTCLLTRLLLDAWTIPSGRRYGPGRAGLRETAAARSSTRNAKDSARKRWRASPSCPS